MCTFPSKLKLADVSPLHKKGVRMDKSNYRPVSILPAISKIYESIMYSDELFYRKYTFKISMWFPKRY